MLRRSNQALEIPRNRRAIDKGTEPGDQFGYQGRDLFRGQFAGVTTRIGVGSDGICPADRGLASY